MHLIRLTESDQMPEAKALEGKFVKRSHYDRVITDTTTVYTHKGSLLFHLQKNAVPRSLYLVAHRAFENVPLHSDNRGAAAGGKRQKRPSKDGRPSNIARSRMVESEVLGFKERAGFTPYCRMTVLTRKHRREMRLLRPLLLHVTEWFARLAPAHYKAQRDFVDNIVQDYRIRGTPFTSVTVNRTFQTAVHNDPGDYSRGLGAMVVTGEWEGGELVFPGYRIAVDVRPGDLLLSNVHELHGNMPIWGAPGFKRMSFVMYAREEMSECLPYEEELRRAQELAK